MRTAIFLLFFSLCCKFLNGQLLPFLDEKHPLRSSHDSARFFYRKGDFAKSLAYYEIFFGTDVTAENNNNYDTYFMAIAYCKTGNTEKALLYLTRSGQIGFDLTAYEDFASDSLNKCLNKTEVWKEYITRFKYKADSLNEFIAVTKKKITDTTIRINSNPLLTPAKWEKIAANKSNKALLKLIKDFKGYSQPAKSGFWTLHFIKDVNNDSIPFLLYIPKNYDYRKKYPLLLFLHGAATYRSNFANPVFTEENEQRLLSTFVTDNYFVLYPYAKRSLNWVQHARVFSIIQNQLILVKSLYHIDDNRVSVAGHSDGARGVLWFALNQRNLFSGFAGMNYSIKLISNKSTFLSNLNNKSPFYSVNSFNDAIFSWAATKPIIEKIQNNNLSFRSFVLNGNHSLPYDNPNDVKFIFDSLKQKTRDPNPAFVSWQTNNTENGRNYWIEITKIDTLLAPKSWHQQSDTELGMNGALLKTKSAKVEAFIKGKNKIEIQTSCVKELKVFINPYLLDTTSAIQIFINGKLSYSGKAPVDNFYTIAHFLATKDKDLIYTGEIKLAVDEQFIPKI